MGMTMQPALLLEGQRGIAARTHWSMEEPVVRALIVDVTRHDTAAVRVGTSRLRTDSAVAHSGVSVTRASPLTVTSVWHSAGKVFKHVPAASDVPGPAALHTMLDARSADEGGDEVVTRVIRVDGGPNIDEGLNVLDTMFIAGEAMVEAIALPELEKGRKQ